jgi:PEP-CTERM motif
LVSYGQATTFAIMYTEMSGPSTGSGTVTINNSVLVPNNQVLEPATDFIDAFNMKFIGVPVLGTLTFTLSDIVDAYLRTDADGDAIDLNFWSYNRIGSGSNTCPTCTNPYIAGVGFLTSTLTIPSDGGLTLTYGLSGGPIPEPATWTTMLLGFGGLALLMRRNRHKSAQPAKAEVAD